LLELLTHKIALPLILLFRKNKVDCTMEQLLDLPDHTLGKDLALYLQEKNFRLVPGYVRHDCKHILLGYEMNEEGEARMQFFFFGNGHYSLPVVMTVILCLFLMPDYWKKFIMEFRKGRYHKAFPDLDYSNAIRKDTAALRQKYNLNTHL
jgi:ubiquinone biosynthesis protein Coq4